MAMRRRFRRSFAGKRGGRKFFWLRAGPFSLDQQTTNPLVLSSTILTEADYQNPTSGVNDAQRGGPRLERVIVDYGWSLEASNNFWRQAGQANIALIPEFMMFVQSAQFATIVVDNATFGSTRDSERVLMDEVPAGAREFQWVASDQTAGIRSVQGRFESKTKVRLADKAIGMAMRGFVDATSGNLLGFTDWVRPTFLVSSP